jgi:DNA-binding NarL/FixJ family response regulator
MKLTDPRLANLDGVARELGEEAGYDAGERLVLHYAGQRIYVPEKMRPKSDLWDALGPIAAKTLARLFGGTHIEVPTGENLSRRKRVAQARALLAGAGQGASKNQVAAQLGIHRRTVQRHRSWLSKRDNRQQTLKF